MPGERRPFCGPEVFDHVIDITDAAVQQSAVSRCAVIGDGRLQQVAETVELVRTGHLCESLFLAIVYVIGIQISARLLRGEYLAGQTIEGRAQIGPILRLQDERYRFHPFVEVRIGVERTAPRRLLAPGEPAEIVDNPVLLELLEHGRDAALHIHAHPLRPEAIAHAHRANRNRVQFGVR